MALSEKIQASLVARKGTEAAKFPPKFETTPKRRDPVFLAGLAFGLVSGITIISVGMRPAPASAPVPVVAAAPEVDTTKMSIEEYGAHLRNQDCSAHGIALGKACDRYAEQQDVKAQAARLDALDREAQAALDRYNNPAAHCSAVLNKCW